MQRIVVLSDTHIPLAAKSLPEEILHDLKKSDLCIHAGDYVDKSVIKEISRHTAFKGVCGNMDGADIKKMLPEKLIIKVESVCIGVAHGGGAPTGIIERVADIFKKDAVSLVIFGHSHRAYDNKHGDRIFFNPGSPTEKFYSSENTYGVIEVDGSDMKRTIVKLKRTK
jgi:putative phosphoesterase